MPLQLDPLVGIALLAIFAAVVMLAMKRASYALAALIVVAPVDFARDAFGTEITLAKVVLVGALVGLTTYPRLWAILRERAVFGVGVALVAVACATALSVLNAQHHGPVLRETLKACEHVLLVATAYLAYRLDEDDDLLRNAFALSAVVVILSALIEPLIGTPSMLIFHATLLPRIAGLLGGPNQLGGFLELAIAVLGAWCIYRPALATQLVLGLCGLACMLTFSRGAFVGVTVVIATLVWFARRDALRAIVPLASGALAGCICALLIFMHQHGLANGVASATLASNYAGGVGNRSELWRAAGLLWRAHPLLGVGAGNFELELSQAGLQGVRTHANSWYLQALVEGGIPLVAATLAFVALALRRLGASAKTLAPWVLGAFAASLALCIHQTVDYLLFYQSFGTPWMLVIGVGLAATMTDRAPSDRAT